MSAYSDFILSTANLERYYRLGDASGGAVDLKNGQTGTYVNSPTRGLAGGLVGDASDTATRFPGTDQAIANHPHVSLPNLALTGAITVECWVRPIAAMASWKRIVQKGPAGYSSAWYLGTLDNTNRLLIIVGNQQVSHASLVIPQNQWSHLAFTYDLTTIRAYQNGAQIATGARTAALGTNGTNPLLVAKGDVSNENWPGDIQDLAIYSRALTATEMKQRWLGGAQRLWRRESGAWVPRPIASKASGAFVEKSITKT